MKRDNFKLELEDYNRIYFNYNVEFITDSTSEIIKFVDNNKECKPQFRNICFQNIDLFRKFLLPSFCVNSNYETVLIEYRCLPHLELLIRNTIIKLGENWSHTVICGNLNHKFMEHMCKNISPNIRVIKTNYDNMTKFEYSNYLKNVSDLSI